MNSNLYAHFKQQLDRRPDDELLTTDDDVRFSCRDIDRESARLSAWLSSLGLEPGDRVSVQAAKSPRALCLYLACLRSGVIYHPLNTGYTSDELAYFFGNAEPALIVCDPASEDAIRPLADAAAVRHVRTLAADGCGSMHTEAQAANVSDAIADVAGDDVAALLYSSGTTGVPKGVMLTHDNLLSNTRALVETWGFTADDRLLHALPIFHVHGLFVATGCALLSGASMRWLAAFDARAVLGYLDECTVMMGVPTYYTRLLAEADFDESHCKSMRVFISGSAPLLEETFAAFRARTGHEILERYGMTETNMNTSNPLAGPRKPGTVGPPLPGVEVRVVNDGGEQLAANEVGNLQVRGANVFKGYWRMPDKTAEDFTSDGFFDTGDKATIDDDGYVSIVGRSKDVVITGGLNVYPKEVELVIDRIDGVSESAVIGVPHADFGEAVVAVVVPVAGASLAEDDVIDAVREKIAAFKVPKRVRFADALPRNSMAKVQKNVLRERYAALFD